MQTDRERCDVEAQRLTNMKAKLEACCREQKEQMTSLAKENQSIAEEERQQHTELKARKRYGKGIMLKSIEINIVYKL